MNRRRLLRILLVLALTGTLVAACSGSSGTDTTPAVTSATAEPTATATPEPPPAPAALAPDGQRILGYVRDLADKIGTRAPGTANERAAAAYLADKLRSFGYDVRLQSFEVTNDGSRDSTLAIRGAEERVVPSVPFEGSAGGIVGGPLIAVPGAGTSNDFPANARGAIVLIERGQLLFREKVANAQSAGAAGVIIFNNETGAFFGSLGERATIPTVSISQLEGQRLLELLAKGPATAQVNVDTLSQSASYNVVATPPGRDCETISGGHYDSVSAGPGANDNGSGSATVLEIASILAANGEMGSNCFVLFGSEEIGLDGSREFVQSLSPDARRKIKAMLNFDMVGVGDEGWQLIGSAQLQERAATLASSMGIPTQRSQTAGTGAGSDHASFINAGIPALFIHRTRDGAWHTPQDTAGRVQPQLLETAARLGLAMLESLNGGT